MKLTMAVLAGLMSVAVAGAYAGEADMKKDARKDMSKPAASKGGAASSSATTAPADDTKKGRRPARATKG